MMRQRLQRGAYLLPSLFTIGNVVLGFYAVVLGTRGHFEKAAVMVFIATVLDGLDGRIARFMNTESEFGKEFDSLADVLTFGATPALLTYFWGLRDFGRPGWLVPLFFLLCTAIRLARFNVQVGTVDSRFFVGMPSPAAACSVCAWLFFSPRPNYWMDWVDPGKVKVAMLGVVALYGVLMVSTFRYPSGKKIDLRRPWSPRSLLTPMTATVLALIWVLDNYPTAFFVTVAVLYTGTGLVRSLRRLFRRHEEKGGSHHPAPAGAEEKPAAPAEGEAVQEALSS